MKIIEKDILPFQDKEYFSPIRDKIDYARLLVFSARNLLLDYDTQGLQINSYMKLIIDKMSRLFFYKENKYFSVSFPFIVIIGGNKVQELTTYTGKNVTFENISAVISIVDNKQFRLNPSLIDFYIESNSIESLGLPLLEEILQFEPSYVRYDNDPVNENGDLHPLYHLDVNYSQHGTFKLGLNENITKTYFENLQNINTKCSFVRD